MDLLESSGGSFIRDFFWESVSASFFSGKNHLTGEGRSEIKGFKNSSTANVHFLLYALTQRNNYAGPKGCCKDLQLNFQHPCFTVRFGAH